LPRGAPARCGWRRWPAADFTSTLSIVPLLAVALAAFAAFPLFAEYRRRSRDAAARLLARRSRRHPALPADFTANAAGLTAWGLRCWSDSAADDPHRRPGAERHLEVQPRSVLARVLVYWTAAHRGPRRSVPA